jgi:hypothetical protein
LIELLWVSYGVRNYDMDSEVALEFKISDTPAPANSTFVVELPFN